MSSQFRIAERVQWFEFVIFMFTMFGPIAVVAVVGNLHPEMISASVAVALIAGGIVSAMIPVAVRKRGRILTVDEWKLTLTHEKTGKLLAEIDLSRPCSIAFAVRQGLIGKSAKTMRRWLQVFIAQNGRILKIESAALESRNLNGIVQSEWLPQIGGLSNNILVSVSEKQCCYDETAYLGINKKPGSAVYGLPAFYEAADEELLKLLIETADKISDKNIFILNSGRIRNTGTSFSSFKKEFMKSAGQLQL